MFETGRPPEDDTRRSMARSNPGLVYFWEPMSGRQRIKSKPEKPPAACGRPGHFSWFEHCPECRAEDWERAITQAPPAEDWGDETTWPRIAGARWIPGREQEDEDRGPRRPKRPIDLARELPYI